MARQSVPFRGAHAVITGGSSGIGLATAKALAARGATVSLVARGADRLALAAEQVRADGATVQVRADGATVRTAAADVADRESLAAAFATLTDAAGPCDILVTCAGVARPGRFLELPDEVFREMIEIDYFGTLHALRLAAPGMAERGRGSVVAVSSAAGLIGIYGYSAYGPAKFAVRGLMESVRAELTPPGCTSAWCTRPTWTPRSWPRRTGTSRPRPGRSAAPSSR